MILRLTSNASVGGIEVKGFPVILSESYDVDWLSLQYFLLIRRSAAVSSLKLYAVHLVDFLSQLEVDNIRLNDVNDDWLAAYKMALLRRKNSSGSYNSKNYAAQVLRTVIHYIYWLERNKFVRNVIGETNEFKVRVEISAQGNRGIRHPLTRKGSTSKVTVTPRKEWIDAVKMQGPAREDLAERFDLMIDWGRSAGLRAKEICGLTKAVLPSRESAERASVQGRKLKVNLPVSKGEKDDAVSVSPQLLIQTWDFIDLYRTDIVEKFTKRFKSRYKIYEDPAEIFLSDKTGRAIDKKSFSNAIRKAYKKAVDAGTLTVDERVWVHGLRHNFVNNLLKGLDAGGVKRPEALARQATRHNHERSLEIYSTDRFNECFNG